jgi:Alpha/beta hydrolase domain
VATLSGPITGGVHGWPFGVAVRDLGAEGYVEEEYFLSGDATPYEFRLGAHMTADGHWDVVEAEPRPFTTRLLIRRPIDPARFNGCVLVCWANVTGGYEIFDGESAQSLNGFAWATVSAQAVGVNGMGAGSSGGLRGWDASRYGSLHLDADDLSYDIFTQAAEAVGPMRADFNGELDPLGGLDVHDVIAVGASQSASRLATYRNAVHPLTEAFDGYLLDVYFGYGSPLGDDPLMRVTADDRAGMAKRSERLRVGAHRLRTDVAVPTLVFNTESEAVGYAKVRQADDAWIRLWELAGAAHYSSHTLGNIRAKAERDFGAPHGSASQPGARLNGLNTEPARDAALLALLEWVRSGDAPREQPRLEIDESTGEIVRDHHGIAVGGIRLPEVDVPIAVHTGANDLPDLGWISGSTRPFDRETLVAEYPDREQYLARYERAARSAHRAGVLLPSDRDVMVAQARQRHLW